MPEIDVKPLMDAATSLQKTLVQMRSKHPDFSKIGVHITETEENKYKEPGTSARIVVVISAATADRAFELAKPFEDNLDCICTSSDETEVTCDCPKAE